ncbi:DUF2061 domain-containing protein [Candidatus Saccharibacteria bacterium]|nr:DUF2061 domain-containing protein [Candidatus Saccharibacteria bacterium]
MRKLQHSETTGRSVVKSITYRICIIISIFIVSYVTTGKLDTTLQITGITTVTGIIIYFIHERVWSLIRWGRK